MENTTRPENTDVTCFQLSKTAQLVTSALSDSVSHLLILASSKHCRAAFLTKTKTLGAIYDLATQLTVPDKLRDLNPDIEGL